MHKSDIDNEHFDICKRVLNISDIKELTRKQFEKEKEEFNGILHASVRTKMLPSDKVMPHDQMHWLKTLIFTPLQFIKAVASDQHNYAINIKMIKGVHKLTLRPNMLISLKNHWTLFNGWLDRQPGGPMCGSRIFVVGPGLTARIQDRHMGYRQTDRHMHVHAPADG